MWKEIPGYEGYYEVDEHGNVRSVERIIERSDGRRSSRKSRIKKQTADKDGYMTVHLSKDGKNRRVKVHRLVAILFVEGYAEGLEVNHKDYDRTNNDYKNLEWATHTDNVNYSVRAGRFKDRSARQNRAVKSGRGTDRDRRKFGADNGMSIPVQICLPNGSVFSFSCIRDCAKFLISSNYIESRSVSGAENMLRRAMNADKRYYSMTVLPQPSQ